MNEIYTDLENNNRTHYQSGAVRDNNNNKEDYIETTSWLAMQAYAKYMTDKAKVYGRGNWRKGIPTESYEQSLMRHLQKYLANKYDDAQLEPNEDHLCAAMFNLMGLIHEREKERLNKIKIGPHEFSPNNNYSIRETTEKKLARIIESQPGRVEEARRFMEAKGHLNKGNELLTTDYG